MKKFIDRLPQERHISLNKTLVTELKKLGFRFVTSSVLEKIWKVYKLKPPKVARSIDVKERAWYIKDINGYTISVFTSFNKVTRRFSPHSAPCIVIEPIVVPDWVDKDKSKLTRFFYRSSELFVGNILSYAKFFTWEFEENRPLAPGYKWAFIREFAHDEFEWIGPSGHVRKLFVHAQSSKHVYVYKDQKKRIAYFKKWRKKRGYKRLRREIRLPYSRR